MTGLGWGVVAFPVFVALVGCAAPSAGTETADLRAVALIVEAPEGAGESYKAAIRYETETEQPYRIEESCFVSAGASPVCFAVYDNRWKLAALADLPAHGIDPERLTGYLVYRTGSAAKRTNAVPATVTVAAWRDTIGRNRKP